MNINDNEITFGLHDLRAQDVDMCGGKGANLAKLAGAGFSVPEARVVSVEAYRAWFAQLSSSILSEPPCGLTNGVVSGFAINDADALSSQCSDLREQLVKVTFPAAIESSLRIELAQLCAEGPVSVRSSATLEDMHGAAFAGQHDTYLGV